MKQQKLEHPSLEGFNHFLGLMGNNRFLESGGSWSTQCPVASYLLHCGYENARVGTELWYYGGEIRSMPMWARRFVQKADHSPSMEFTGNNCISIMRGIEEEVREAWKR